jgi:hypothetical protein
MASPNDRHNMDITVSLRIHDVKGDGFTRAKDPVSVLISFLIAPLHPTPNPKPFACIAQFSHTANFSSFFRKFCNFPWTELVFARRRLDNCPHRPPQKIPRTKP